MNKTIIDYGYPSPFLFSAHDPWYALMLALRERELVTEYEFSNDEEFLNKLQDEADELDLRLKKFRKFNAGFSGKLVTDFYEFDERLSNVCSKYINQFKPFNPENPPYWTFEELTEYASGGEAVVEKMNRSLRPELSVDYAIQRMKAIQALRITCEYGTRLWKEEYTTTLGEDNKESSNPHNAVRSAISAAERGTSDVIFPRQHFSFGFDFDRSVYCAGVDVADYIFSPVKLSVSSVMYAQAASSGDIFFGWGVVQEDLEWVEIASNNGFHIDANQIIENIDNMINATKNTGSIATFGFTFRNFTCTYDYGNLFKFAPPVLTNS